MRALLWIAALLFAGAAQSAEPIRFGMIEALSGPFGNAGEAVARVNARGGVRLPGGARPLRLEVYDSKGQAEEALVMLRRAAAAAC